jgi:hypothetical protein
MPSHNLRLSIQAPKSDIYVRWITPGRALDFPTLSAIPIDHKPIEKTTTIYDLKGIAIERVYRCPTGNEASTIEDFTLEIFSLPCAVADASMTLECLGCAGTMESPLDVFVVPRSKGTIDEDKPFQ